MASEFIAAQASVLLVPSVKGFRNRLKAQLATVNESVKIEVEAQTSKALAEIAAAKELAERDPIRLNVDTKGITEIRHKYEDLRGKFRKGLVVNIAVVGAAQLTQLGPALAALNQSVVALSQSSALLPGILSGVASSFGTLAVGSRGVKDAFKAVAAAQKDSADAARKQRDANRAVTDATRDLSRATKDAKRNLEDLNDQLRSAPLDEAEAVLNLQEARNEAAQAFGKTALQQQRDALNVQKAEEALASTRRRGARLVDDVAEANRKGVQGADAVVAATERLAKAQEDAARGSSAMADLAQAMAELSPHAQDFVQRVTSLQGAWDGLRGAVQDRLFANLGADIQGLAGTSLPMLERGMTGIAGAINGNLRTAIAELGSGGNQSMVEHIFGNTADAQAMLDRAIGPMLDAFLRLSSVGSNYLPRMADGFGDVMRRFDTFISKAEADGSLDKWINAGIDALKNLGNSLINIGSILNSISEAFTGSGGKGFLQVLAEGTKRLADFLKGAEGQQKLRQFFYEARAELSNWKPMLRELPGIIRNVMNAGQAWANMLLPFLRTTAELLRAHPGLVQTILFAYLGWRTISPIVKGIGAALDGMKVALGGVSAAFGGGNTGVNGKASAFSSLMGVGGPIAVGVAAVASLLAYQYVNAQQEAAEATQYHANMVAQLRNEMDGLSGSLTQKGLLDKLNRAAGFVDNNETNAKPRDLPGLAESQFGVSRDQFGQALVPSNQAARDEVVSKAREAILAELNSKSTKELVGEFDASFLDTNRTLPDGDPRKITNEVLARALTGDSKAREQFENARMPFSLSDVLYGYNNPLDWVPFAEGDTPGLSEKARAGANISRFITDDTNHANQVGAETRANNQAVAGRARFKPGVGNPFAALGNPQPYWEPGGQGKAGIRVNALLRDMQKDQPGLVEAIRKNGGQFEELVDGTVIHLDPDRAKLYLDSYADGGMFSGAGTGRSDSMIARVSNGEFITRASSVAKYGSAFMHAVNEGKIDRDQLPGFDKGGEVGPQLITAPVKPRTDYKVVPNMPPVAPPAPAPAPAAPAAPAFPDMPDTSNPGLYDPATGNYSKLPSDLGNAGDTSGQNVPQAPTVVQTPQGPQIASPGGINPLQLGGGLKSLPENLNPVSILEDIGQIILQAIAGFFGIDLSYLNAGRQLLSGVTGQFGAAANPEAQQLMDQVPSPLPNSQSAFVPQSGAGATAFERASAMADSMRGKPYVWGGGSLDGTDCSGLVMYVADAYTGRPFSGRSGGTGTEGETLRAKGAVLISDPSQAPPGTLRIGWNASHTAGTLPDGRNFEASNENTPITIGSGAAGYSSGQFTNWAYFPVPAYANGGFLSGAGTGSSDSMLARVSNGEFITRASSVAKYGSGFFHALNEGKIDRGSLPGFAEGDLVGVPVVPPPAPTPPAGPNPAPAPAAQSVGPLPAPTEAAQAPQSQGLPTDTATQAVGDAMSSIGSALGGGSAGGGASPGAEAPEGATPEQDPRSILGAAPKNQDHNAPWLSKGIQGAASTIGSAIGSAIGAAGAAGGAFAPGSGAAASAAASMAQGGAQIAGQAVSGVVNVLSSLLVGTASGGTTQGAYGAPVLPQGPPQSQGRGPGIVNNYGDIHTANYDEFYKGQQRREAQQQAPILPMR